MSGHARRKLDYLQRAKTLLLRSEQGITFTELADIIGVDRSTAYRYVRELEAIADADGRYTLRPSPEDVELATIVLSPRWGDSKE